MQRAQIVLACGAGETNTAIAKRMGLTGMTVGKWRKRYRDLGLEGLHDELRPGRPRTYEDDKVAETINRALQGKPAEAVRSGKLAPWRLLPASPKARRTSGCNPFRCNPTARDPTTTGTQEEARPSITNQNITRTEVHRIFAEK